MKPSSTKGKFITIEGIEGVGKSTLIQNLAQYLKQYQIPHLITKEPGGTPLGHKLREILFDPTNKIEPMTELLLMFADRNEHYHKVIEPALKSGKIVISDRFVDSTYAYQGAGRGIDSMTIKQLETLCYGQFHPDLVLWLDLPVNEAFKRVSARNEQTNRFEEEKQEFFQKARAMFEKRAQTFQYFKRIDATKEPSEVLQSALMYLNQL